MKACAYIVGPDDGPSTMLRDLARQVGFETVLSYKSVAACERQSLTTALVYFLFAAVTDTQTLKPIAQAVRASTNPRIRFSPLIYFSESPSLDAIRACINIGFDDVITLPFTLARVEERLDRQVEHKLVYYETPTYFGPDRRGRLKDEEGHKNRGTGGEHRRIEIVRSPGYGVQILRDDMRLMI